MAQLNWIFGQPGPHAKHREPVQAEFFRNTESIKSTQQALVREVIQNVLDQADPKDATVRVRLALGTGDHALEPETAARYTYGLWPHVAAVGKTSTTAADACRFLVVEDFNTTGLRGPTATNAPIGNGDPDDFYHFFRAEGKSPKHSGQAGRRGVGKITIPMSSSIFSFFGYSIRRFPTTAEPAGILMGQCTMVHHTVDGLRFDPDGWWGYSASEDQPVVPFVDVAVIEEFRDDWGVIRRDEPGLSIVIPYLDEEWNADGLALAVVDDYFVPIRMGKLEVEIEEVGGRYHRLDASGLLKFVEALEDGNPKARLLQDIKYLELMHSEDPALLSVSHTAAPKWSNAELDAAQLKSLDETLREKGWVHVRVPVRIKLSKRGPAQDSHFDLMLVAEEGASDLPLVVRAGIVIKNAARGRTSGYRSILLIEDAVLSEFAGDAEGAAHVDWNAQAERFKDKYEYGSSTLSFLRMAAADLLRKINGSDDKPDSTLARHFFPKPSLAGPGKGKAGSDGSGDASGTDTGGAVAGGEPKVPKLPVTNSLLVSQTPASFRITTNPEWTKAVATSAILQVAYSVSRGDPFKKWEAYDFAFAPNADGPVLTILAEGCTVSASNNEVTIKDIDPATFEIEVDGFDLNRDVEVRLEEQR